jgi:hypothetical protein
MTTPDTSPSPDVVISHHPEFGITATTPTPLVGAAWILERFDFRPVPGHHPALYALADQERNGQGRATRAVEMLRVAGYRVQADRVFDPGPAPRGAPTRERPPSVEPDVAFAEHPRLGVVAATTDGAVRGGQLLEDHGWRHDPHLDIYAPPNTANRGEALGKVAEATLAMQRAGLHVAVQPHLAQDVAAHRAQRHSVAAHHQHSDNFTARKMPVVNTAAFTASSAHTSLPGKAPTPAPGAPAPAAGPVDPRIAFSRNR